MTIEEQESYIYSRLRHEREKLNMSQMELSLLSGVSQNMITYIETGKRTPTLTTILKLCGALKISPASIFPKIIVEDKKEAKDIIIQLVEEFM